jgi:CrcB protein
LQKYIYIALGGSLGSIARYWVGSTIASRLGTKFPYGTFVINITACVIIGFSLTYSTFSTYEWETLSTVRSGAFLEASLYAFSSLFLGLIAVWAGILIAEKFL